MRVPHPIPYQGSKRNLASAILGYFPAKVAVLIEPFAGSAAVTLAAAARGLAERYVINDLNRPLVELWLAITESPEKLARQYESLWRAQHEDRRRYYDRVRDDFNRTGRPDCLLYLLARCVKASVRYNANGQFNQSPDNRRMGALPETMRAHILGAAHLLQGRSSQATLLGRAEVTVESLYLSPALEESLHRRRPYARLNAAVRLGEPGQVPMPFGNCLAPVGGHCPGGTFENSPAFQRWVSRS
jgi:DNA adenine methylase